MGQRHRRGIGPISAHVAGPLSLLRQVQECPQRNCLRAEQPEESYPCPLSGLHASPAIASGAMPGFQKRLRPGTKRAAQDVTRWQATVDEMREFARAAYPTRPHA